jgi:sulfur dioxygenase
MRLIFRQLKDESTSTYTYIFGDEKTKEVAIVDSVHENIDAYVSLLKNNDWNLKYLIETHTHADHITAILRLKKIFPFVEVLLGKNSEAKYKVTRVTDKEIKSVGQFQIQFFETPGHTNDSISILVDGNRLLTGDCLFIGSCGRTDFQLGSNKEMFLSINRIANFQNDILIYPGHDYNNRFVSTVQEEKIKNKALQHVSLEDFEKDLNSWNLPPPKKIKESVPANLVGGME